MSYTLTESDMAGHVLQHSGMSENCVFHLELIGIRNFNVLINKSKFTKGSIRSQEVVGKGGKRKESQILLFYFSLKIRRKIKYDENSL